ncbi:arginyltransferase [Teredinibacter sp. KSP-S5-2]|uniref:arginyltransferase n=1 Tax=Teredinibacter sp. KSP-S5-2 TaxID=3034506 RepID=UPI00293432B5|nr:arginyltransferase [Teredinibacter sp. KSP-S5-2]WNO07549.1 arginyltransferase [Teredinibacter sp. KSP-S5-2]
MTDLADLKLFVTSEHDCSYLPSEQAASIFVDPYTDLENQTFSQLSEIGFRRSGKHVYRPHCSNCNACIAIRVPITSFKPNKSQRRCMQKNSDLSHEVIPSIDTDEHYELYRRYIELRHKDGDMYPPSREQYHDFLSIQFNATRYLEFREKGKLLAVAVSDLLDSGLSAVYTFFDGSQTKRSLGVYGVLFQIQHAKELGLPYLYLGYWIKECQKMSYKVNYRPFQLYINNQWVTFN